jgi:hypothetical protein
MERKVFGLALLLRLVILFYGEWQDRHSMFEERRKGSFAEGADGTCCLAALLVVVKFTDIDYMVYTDASRIVWEGADTPACTSSVPDELRSLPATNTSTPEQQPSASASALPDWFVALRRWADCHSPYQRATYRYTPLLYVEQNLCFPTALIKMHLSVRL